ncbi:MAG: anthranilate synthase component I [Elusimicrobia bacterium CG11_big_fil_rev_8_21_14_0_20_64_6]|nr:MAG: anthranilate synthase component I [Elusimicrobia bacterium CG11_big_fil_rev_8_21_14_0_20_64_6]
MPEILSVVDLDLHLKGLDPASCFERLAGKNGRGYLIEKIEDGRRRAWIGVQPFETLRVINGRVYSVTARRKKKLPGEPFAVLGKRLARFKSRGGVPFDAGAVGLLDYEMIRHLEPVEMQAHSAEGFLMLFNATVFIEDGKASLRALVSGAAGRRRAKELALRLREVLRGAGIAPVPAPAGRLLPVQAERGRSRYLKSVAKIKKHILDGDVFQAVVSESFSARVGGGPFAVYRAVRATNGTPYGFCLIDGERAWIGASPERLVRIVNGVARNCPIAGTRPRGATRARDKSLEAEMRASEKECAEHLMLVDLARNDLGRVCAPGSVAVERFMLTRRFSNVMHLVSEVVGRLDKGKTAWDALLASFPAGTVSGAPKVRAMEIIAGLERAPRGFYAGAVVQADFAGNLDSCLAIRSLELEGDRARLQAGAGIVADSSPAAEWNEVLHKLAGLRRALGGQK